MTGRPQPQLQVPAQRADLADWGRRVVPGGTMLVHDAFSSIGVTSALLVVCAGSREWRYARRTGSLAEYERRVSGAGRGASNDTHFVLSQLDKYHWNPHH